MVLSSVTKRRSAGFLLTAAVLALIPGAARAQLSIYGWYSDSPTYDYGGIAAGYDYGGVTAGFGYGVEGFAYPNAGSNFGLSGWDYGMGGSDDRWTGFEAPVDGYGSAYGPAYSGNAVPSSDPLLVAGFEFR